MLSVQSPSVVTSEREGGGGGGVGGLVGILWRGEGGLVGILWIFFTRRQVILGEIQINDVGVTCDGVDRERPVLPLMR